MLLVWGWKVVFKVVGSGVFSCPNCGGDRNYERRRAQRWFTFFFIPIIPLKVIGEVVRCTYCKNDFRASVLERPTATQFTDLLQNSVRGVMVNVLRRGAWNHPAARALAVQEITLAGTVGYTDGNLDADFQAVPEDLSPLLGPLSAQLPQSGREALVAGAARVAAADGPIQPAERQLIDMVGSALGMTAAHVAGVVAQTAPGGAPVAPVGGPSFDQAPGASGFGQAPVAQGAPGFGPGSGFGRPQGGPGAQAQGVPSAPTYGQAPVQDAVPSGSAFMPTQAMPVPQQTAAPAPVQDEGFVDPANQPTHIVRIPEQQSNDVNYRQQQ
jgi:hypothetical protein